uniref:Uncharacterized protein n=1 Tax=Anguilla anguilla TaxID=7936 RepID=A0A0E9WKD2_ANGAN
MHFVRLSLIFVIDWLNNSYYDYYLWRKLHIFVVQLLAGHPGLHILVSMQSG